MPYSTLRRSRFQINDYSSCHTLKRLRVQASHCASESSIKSDVKGTSSKYRSTNPDSTVCRHRISRMGSNFIDSHTFTQSSITAESVKAMLKPVCNCRMLDSCRTMRSYSFFRKQRRRARYIRAALWIFFAALYVIGRVKPVKIPWVDD